MSDLHEGALPLLTSAACVQVFLLGRQLCAVWRPIGRPLTVGSAQQQRQPEDPCTLR